MQYNFHKMVKDFKHDPYGFALPEDINEPVIKFLESIGCYSAVVRLRALQKKLRFGTIRAVRKDKPNIVLVVEVKYGMVKEYEQIETIEDDVWSVVQSHTIKNSNVTLEREE